MLKDKINILTNAVKQYKSMEETLQNALTLLPLFKEPRIIFQVHCLLSLTWDRAQGL